MRMVWKQIYNMRSSTEIPRKLLKRLENIDLLSPVATTIHFSSAWVKVVILVIFQGFWIARDGVQNDRMASQYHFGPHQGCRLKNSRAFRSAYFETSWRMHRHGRKLAKWSNFDLLRLPKQKTLSSIGL